MTEQTSFLADSPMDRREQQESRAAKKRGEDRKGPPALPDASSAAGKALIAKRKQRGGIVAQKDAQCEGHLWAVIPTLWTLGREFHETQERIDACMAVMMRLGPKLKAAGPDHPRSAHFQEIYDEHQASQFELQAIRTGIEDEARPLVARMAAAYDAMSKKGKEDLRAIPGWSRAFSPQVFASEMWSRAKDRRPFPQGEAL
jgi:hypothetical protein